MKEFFISMVYSILVLLHYDDLLKHDSWLRGFKSRTSHFFLLIPDFTYIETSCRYSSYNQCQG